MKPDVLEEKTSGGIILAETIRQGHDQAQTTGVLVAVGPEAWDGKYPWAKVGDHVLFARYGGLILNGMDGEAYRMLNDEQVTAVVDASFRVSEVEKVSHKRKAYG